MMGQQQNQKDLFSYHIDLDRRVRSEHPLRKIQAAIDWNFVRTAVAACYGRNGNVSVDPVVILKMMFLLFYDNVASERELLRVIPERLDYLWFLGYGLDEVIPGHSVLSKARARWGGQVFEKLFLHTVGQACAAGLVDGAKLHLDSSLVEANADPQKTWSGPPELIAALKTAYAVQEQKLDEHPRRAHYQKKNRQLIHPTDPDAPTMSRGPGNKYSQARPRYKEHRAIDERCGVITAVQTTGADVEDGDLLEELIDQHQDSTEQTAQTVVTDSHYGTIGNFRKLQERGLRTHMAPRRPPGPAVDSGKFPASDFTYHAAADTYTCPAGATLERRNYDRFRSAWLYKGQGGGLSALSAARALHSIGQRAYCHALRKPGTDRSGGGSVAKPGRPARSTATPAFGGREFCRGGQPTPPAAAALAAAVATADSKLAHRGGAKHQKTDWPRSESPLGCARLGGEVRAAVGFKSETKGELSVLFFQRTLVTLSGCPLFHLPPN